MLAVSGCAPVVAGTPTWPGATMEKVLLTPADFPPGVQVDRVTDDGLGPADRVDRRRCCPPRPDAVTG